MEGDVAYRKFKKILTDAGLEERRAIDAAAKCAELAVKFAQEFHSEVMADVRGQ